jgi:hypothetical protein
MPIRLRKLLGAIALIVLTLAWALGAMALAQPPAIKAYGVIEVIYYIPPSRSFDNDRGCHSRPVVVGAARTEQPRTL